MPLSTHFIETPVESAVRAMARPNARAEKDAYERRVNLLATPERLTEDVTRIIPQIEDILDGLLRDTDELLRDDPDAYDEIYDDDQITTSIDNAFLPVAQSDFTFKARGEASEKLVKPFREHAIDGAPAWERMAQHLLHCEITGIQIVRIVWMNAGTVRNPKWQVAQFVIKDKRRFRPADADWQNMFLVDDGITPVGVGGTLYHGTRKPVQRDHFIIHTWNNTEDTLGWGRGIGGRLYRLARYRRPLIHIMLQGLENYAGGIRFVLSRSEALSVLKSSEQESWMSSVRQEVANAVSGDTVVLPPGAEPQVFFPPASVASVIKDVVDGYFDQQVTKTILGATLTEDQTSVGSYALGQEHSMTVHRRHQYRANRLVESLQSDYIVQWASLNPWVFDDAGVPRDTPLPVLKARVPGGDPLSEKADWLNKAVVPVPKAWYASEAGYELAGDDAVRNGEAFVPAQAMPQGMGMGGPGAGGAGGGGLGLLGAVGPDGKPQADGEPLAAEGHPPPTMQEVSLALERSVNNGDRLTANVMRKKMHALLGETPVTVPDISDEEWGEMRKGSGGAGGDGGPPNGPPPPPGGGDDGGQPAKLEADAPPQTEGELAATLRARRPWWEHVRPEDTIRRANLGGQFKDGGGRVGAKPGEVSGGDGGGSAKVSSSELAKLKADGTFVPAWWPGDGSAGNSRGDLSPEQKAVYDHFQDHGGSLEGFKPEKPGETEASTIDKADVDKPAPSKGERLLEGAAPGLARRVTTSERAPMHTPKDPLGFAAKLFGKSDAWKDPGTAYDHTAVRNSVGEKLDGALRDIQKAVGLFTKDPVGTAKAKVTEVADKITGEFEDAGMSPPAARAAAMTIAATLVSPVGLGTLAAPALLGLGPVGIPLAILANSPVAGLAQAFVMKEAVKLGARGYSKIKEAVASRAKPALADRRWRWGMRAAPRAESDHTVADLAATVGAVFAGMPDTLAPIAQAYVFEARLAGLELDDALEAMAEDVGGLSTELMQDREGGAHRAEPKGGQFAKGGGRVAGKGEKPKGAIGKVKAAAGKVVEKGKAAAKEKVADLKKAASEALADIKAGQVHKPILRTAKALNSKRKELVAELTKEGVPKVIAHGASLAGAILATTPISASTLAAPWLAQIDPALGVLATLPGWGPVEGISILKSAKYVGKARKLVKSIMAKRKAKRKERKKDVQTTPSRNGSGPVASGGTGKAADKPTGGGRGPDGASGGRGPAAGGSAGGSKEGGAKPAQVARPKPKPRKKSIFGVGEKPPPRAAVGTKGNLFGVGQKVKPRKSLFGPIPRREAEKPPPEPRRKNEP